VRIAIFIGEVASHAQHEAVPFVSLRSAEKREFMRRSPRPGTSTLMERIDMATATKKAAPAKKAPAKKAAPAKKVTQK